jgi:MFS family permease
MKTTPTPTAHALLLLLLVLAGLDQTLLSAALPTIVRELGGAEHSSWVFTAFLLASTVAMPVYGKLADRWGVRPPLLGAAAVFIMGSLASGAAPTMDALIAARALQGLGGGGLMTLALLAASALSTPEERTGRMARLGAAYGLATMAGPIAGAYVTQHLSWRWSLFAALPLALAAWAGLARTPMAPPQGERRALDWRGALLLGALLVCALLATRSRALGATVAAVLGAAALALLPVWLWSQRRAADPIVPLSLFARPGFAANAWLAASAGMSLFAAVVFVPIFLQGVLHLTPTASTWHLLPLMAGLLIGSRRAAARLRRGVAPRSLAAAASTAMAVSLAALAGLLLGGIPSAWTMSAVLLPLGLGLGLTLPVLSIVSQRAALSTQSGIAVALPMMLRALGGATGVALLGEVLARHAADGLVAALADVFTAVALAALPACAAAWALPLRLAPAAAARAAAG